MSTPPNLRSPKMDLPLSSRSFPPLHGLPSTKSREVSSSLVRHNLAGPIHDTGGCRKSYRAPFVVETPSIALCRRCRKGGVITREGSKVAHLWIWAESLPLEVIGSIPSLPWYAATHFITDTGLSSSCYSISHHSAESSLRRSRPAVSIATT
ncbi:hypothetical protein ZIOFF_050826 [Zingiber officinale]|uniref:Uncharacterized protein n=1 Tax=Zingiber officinale TaxID=94328 RepID=A0A8J5FS80_ZINOF|nr:hypothetical protein ZIOFF_050826 [Zingiber officinale]